MIESTTSSSITNTNSNDHRNSNQDADYDDQIVSSLEHGELNVVSMMTSLQQQKNNFKEEDEEEEYEDNCNINDDKNDNKIDSKNILNENDNNNNNNNNTKVHLEQQKTATTIFEDVSGARHGPVDTSTRDCTDSIPRLVRRNLPFHQSRNQLGIRNYIPSSSDRYYYIATNTHYSYGQLYKILTSNWFHVSLSAPLYVTLTGLLVIWTLMIILWAGVYMGIDRMEPDVSCGLGPAGAPIQFYGAFAFSLETCTTVGYGLPSSVNSFFENCPTLQVGIYVQMVWSMLFNAFLISYFYAKSGQCSSRAFQVVFSNKAIISISKPTGPGEDPQVRLQVRVYDYDSDTPTIESHVRMYVVMKDRPVPRQLRLFIPDDELGGMVFLSIPFVVNHHIDLYSLLHPPVPVYQPTNATDNDNSTGNDADSNEDTINNKLPYVTTTNGLPAIRQIDSLTGNQDMIICPVCGESYGTVERWIQHVKNFTLAEQQGKYPIKGSHQELVLDDSIFDYARSALKPTLDIQSVHDYFQQYVSEIIVVVEAIEPTTSGTFSALQSYMYEDIVFNKDAIFKPCIVYDNVDGNSKTTSKTCIDLDLFHDVVYNVSSTTTTTTTKR